MPIIAEFSGLGLAMPASKGGVSSGSGFATDSKSSSGSSSGSGYGRSAVSTGGASAWGVGNRPGSKSTDSGFGSSLTPGEKKYLESKGLLEDLPSLEKPAVAVAPPVAVSRADYESALVASILKATGADNAAITESMQAAVTFKGYQLIVPDWKLYLAAPAVIDRYAGMTRSPSQTKSDALRSMWNLAIDQPSAAKKRVRAAGGISRDAVVASPEWYNLLFSIGASEAVVIKDYDPPQYITDPVRKAPLPNLSEAGSVGYVNVIKTAIMRFYPDYPAALGPAVSGPIIDGLYYRDVVKKAEGKDAAFQEYQQKMAAYNEREKYRAARAQALAEYRGNAAATFTNSKKSGFGPAGRTGMSVGAGKATVSTKPGFAFNSGSIDKSEKKDTDVPPDAGTATPPKEAQEAKKGPNVLLIGAVAVVGIFLLTRRG